MTVTAGSSQRSRLLFTFAEGDFAVVRPIAEQLRRENSDLFVDFSTTSEPFLAPQSEYIRASIAVRVRRSLATVCLFGPDTFADDWVLWTLEAAHSFARPIVGCPITASPDPDAQDLFLSLGAALVAPRPELLDRYLAGIDAERDGRPAVDEEAAVSLRPTSFPVRPRAARPAPAAQ